MLYGCGSVCCIPWALRLVRDVTPATCNNRSKLSPSARPGHRSTSPSLADPAPSSRPTAPQSHVHYASREFAAPASRLVALVREFDVGKLAGQLSDFHVHSSSPSLTRVEYVSSLPWPFEPRWILADMQFGVDRTTGHYLILGRSVPGAQVPADKPHTSLGTVHYSMYIIEPRGEDRCVMRRAINVDMHIKLPSFVIRKSLVAHYISDMAVVEKELGRKWPGSELERRFGERECYRLLERASTEARGTS